MIRKLKFLQIQVVLFSQHSLNGSLFKADLVKKTAELIKIPENNIPDSPLEIPAAFAAARNIASNITNAAIPSDGFKYVI